MNSAIVLGGSFDPPHLGHLTLASELLKQHPEKLLLIVPTASQPLKKTMTAFSDRLKMCELSFSSLSKNGKLEISPIEQETSCKSTWDLLQTLKQNFKTITVVIGVDQLIQLKHWWRFPEVVEACHWQVALRKGFDALLVKKSLQELIETQVLKSNGSERSFLTKSEKSHLKLMETAAPEVSSTFIREQFALGKKQVVMNLVSDSTLEYIERNHLYGN